MFRYFICAVVVIWLLLIFGLSQQPATESNHLSKQVTNAIGAIIEKVDPDKELTQKYTNRYVRENAHFFVFLVLGGLLVTTLKNFGMTGWKGILTSFVLCVIFAILDEVHQLFVDGRGAQLKDLKLDVAGASVGILLVCVFKWIGKKISLAKY